jgi:hypothetical protein
VCRFRMRSQIPSAKSTTRRSEPAPAIQIT